MISFRAAIQGARDVEEAIVRLQEKLGPMTDDQPTDDIVLPDDDLDSDELGDPDVDTDRVET